MNPERGEITRLGRFAGRPSLIAQAEGSGRPTVGGQVVTPVVTQPPEGTHVKTEARGESLRMGC